MGQLDGKVAVITGGESGIGFASAQLFVREGARVHLIGLQEALLEESVERLGPDRAYASVADVTDEQATHDALESGYQHFGRLDVLFSNAGISGAVRPLVDYPGDVFARTLAVHVGGAFHVLKHGLPRLTDGGSVIITSSVVGLIGFGNISGYVAAKHAQVGLMRAAAKEVAGRRIRVNTLHPGPTSTAFQDAIEMEATGLPQAEAARV
ncbi:MAG: SDR family NAD(P)-dependent oxidoreductase, partial [Actinomycetes bacterium]